MNLNVGVVTNLKIVRAMLAANPQAALHFVLPDGTRIPPHFHVTEVGRVRKDFIDCGGTVRSTERCVLQLWVAEDDGHRLTASKLAGIITMGMAVLGSEALAVEVEYDLGTITQLPVNGVERTEEGIVFHLGGKQTACLAPDRCGVAVTGAKCC